MHYISISDDDLDDLAVCQTVRVVLVKFIGNMNKIFGTCQISGILWAEYYIIMHYILISDNYLDDLAFC